MGLMNGISRGLSAAGYAGGEMYAKGALEDQRAAIQAERDARVAEMQEAAGIRSENRGMANRAKERGAIVEENLTNAPRLRESKVADATAEKKGELDFYTANESTLLKKTRDTARAGHIDDGAGLRKVQIETANLTLTEKKKVNELMTEYETTQDPARKASIMQALTVRGVVKPGEHDTEKVTVEKMNDDGTTTKTERTQKRQGGLINSGGGAGKSDVRVAGKVIGQASTPEEAQALVREYTAGSKKPEGAPAAKVPGRPFYDASLSELRRVAAKPKGISTDEANAARAELESRKGESRISGL
jgi:hypothetical protein